MENYQNIIANQRRAAQSGNTFITSNPANLDEAVATYPKSDTNDLAIAIDAAHTAAHGWAAVPMPARAAYLRKAAAILSSRVDEVAHLFTREEGKTLPEATGETKRAVEILEYFAGQGRYPMGEQYPPEAPDNLLYTVRDPLGVVGLITPWNFPIAIPTWKLAPALLYGNTVVLKPASAAPSPAFALADALIEAGLPAGVLNVVTGPGKVIGTAMANSPLIAGISFTGSEEAGNELYQNASPSRKKMQMELGGKNPLVVLADADLKKAADAAVFGAFWSAGQKCTATSRVIVEAKVFDEFVEMVLSRTKALKVGNGLAADTQISPMIDRSAVSVAHQLCQAGESDGAKCLLGGNPLTDDEYAKGCYFAPSVYTLSKPEGALWTEELFAPVTALIAASDPVEALRLANDTRFGLVASVFTGSLRWANYFAEGFATGMAQVNRATVGADVHVPFGGTKGSGSGSKEQGLAARDFYTKTKTVYVQF